MRRDSARKATLAAWIATVLVLLLFCIVSFFQPPGKDSSAFAYVAQGILEGDLPYVDRWDHKAPLIYALNVIGVALSDIWGIRLLEMTFLLLTTSVAYLLVRKFGTVGKLFSLSIFLGYFGMFVLKGNYTEEYALLFQFLALYLFTVDERLENSFWVPLLLGTLGAAAFLLRPNLIGVWIAIGLYWLLVHRGGSRKRLLGASFGGILPLLAVAGSFAALGGLSPLLDAVFHFNLEYSSISLEERLSAVWRVGGTSLVFLLLPLVFSWCAGFYRLVIAEGRQREDTDGLLGVALILLPVDILLVSLSGFDFRHYYLTLLPAVTVLMAFAASRLNGLVSIPSSLASVALLLSVTLYFLPPGLKGIQESLRSYGEGTALVDPGHALVAARIASETTEDDTILVWGHQPQLYLLSGRAAPTRFFYQYPLVLDGYSSPKLLEEFISDITAARPELIIDAHNEKLPDLGSAERPEGRISVGKYSHSPEDFRGLFAVVSEDYRLLDEIEGYTIYKRID